MGSIETPIEVGSVVVEEKVLDAVSKLETVNGKDVQDVKVDEILTSGHGKSQVNGIVNEALEVPRSESPYAILEEPNHRGRKIRVITIGAGASALNFAHDIDTSPLEIELAIYEKNPEIGGTWYENKWVSNPILRP